MGAQSKKEALHISKSVRVEIKRSFEGLFFYAAALFAQQSKKCEVKKEIFIGKESLHNYTCT